MTDFWLVFPLAILIGIVLGALGSGGAILALPVLVYAAALPVQQAVAVSQLVVGLASLVGTLLQLPSGRLVWREVVLFAIVGIPATRLGSMLARGLDPQLLMLTFAGVILLAGFRLWRTAHVEPVPGHPRLWVTLLLGAVVGLLTGLLGVGGGFLLVPAMITFGGLDARRATATSLPVIAINTLSSALVQRDQWLAVTGLAMSFLGATLIGTFAGLRLARTASESRLRHGLAFVLLTVGILVALRNAFAALG